MGWGMEGVCGRGCGLRIGDDGLAHTLTGNG